VGLEQAWDREKRRRLSRSDEDALAKNMDFEAQFGIVHIAF